MRSSWPKLGRHLSQRLSTRPASSWVMVLLPFLIVCGVLLLTDSTNAAPQPQPRVLLSQLGSGQAQQPPCQECHPDEYKVWKDSTHAMAALDPAFQDQLAKSHNQQECLKCHTTGFDTRSGKFLSGGVTCEACHGEYKQGHPAAQTMRVPMESGTCRMCHEAAFVEWENSKHAAKQIDCFDCHNSHSQGVRTGSPEKLCAACHNDQKTRLAHSVHGISGIECGSCHMAQETQQRAGPTGTTISAATHTFRVPSDVCARCHSSEVHASNRLAVPPSLAQVAEADIQKLQQANVRVNELEAEVTELQRRLDSLRDVGVISIGLAFGIGSFVGLLIGIGGMALLRRKPASSSEQ